MDDLIPCPAPSCLEEATKDQLWAELSDRFDNCALVFSGPDGRKRNEPEVEVWVRASPSELYGLAYSLSMAAEGRMSNCKFNDSTQQDDDDDEQPKYEPRG